MIANPTSFAARKAQGLLGDPVAAKLNPQTVAALQQIASKPVGANPADDAAVDAALKEAAANGWEPDKSGWWKALLITAGFAGGGLALASALAPAAAGTATTGGAISSSTAPDLFAGQIASDVVPAGGTTFASALSKLAGGKAGLISDGLNLVGAAMSSSAAKDAAKTQADSAQKAIDQLGPMYAPYQQAGQQGLGNLQNFLSGGQQPQQPTPAALPNGWQPINGYGQQSLPPQSTAGQPFSMGNLGNLTARTGGMMPRPDLSQNQPNVSTSAGSVSNSGQSGQVTLKAPDGSTRQVPDMAHAQAMIQASGGRLAMVQ